MTTLTQAQVQMYAQSAGLSADRAAIAAAIAMAESGGRTTAHNPVPPDDSYGLWQINMIGSMGPNRRRQFGLTSNTDLYDPAVNARAMAAISSQGSNFSPWSTYGSGAYKKHLSGVVQADNLFGFPLPDGVPNPFEVGPVGGLLDALRGINAIAEVVVGGARWVAQPHNWIRAVEVGVGALLVGVGLAVMTRGTWEPAVKTAAKFTPAGGAKSLVKSPKKAPATSSPKPSATTTKPKAKTAPKPKPKPKPKPAPTPEAAPA